MTRMLTTKYWQGKSLQKYPHQISEPMIGSRLYMRVKFFLGIVLELREGQCLVPCLKIPFGIQELQELESEQEAVFYDTVYSNDGYKPTLKAFGREWHYIY